MTLRELERFVGRPYGPQRDCFDFVVEVQREAFGRDLSLLSAKGHVYRTGSLARLGAIARHRHGGGDVQRTPNPATGDVALLKHASASGVGMAWHLGVVVVERGEVWLLHCAGKEGCSTLQRLTDVTRYMSLEGFWAVRGAAQEVQA